MGLLGSYFSSDEILQTMWDAEGRSGTGKTSFCRPGAQKQPLDTGCLPWWSRSWRHFGRRGIARLGDCGKCSASAREIVDEKTASATG